jgi:thymidine kinase
MAKLYFRYGTVGSGKTLALVSVALTYRAQGKSVHIIQPEVDVRFGKGSVRSRLGIQVGADAVLPADADLVQHLPAACDLILVDEVQFLSANQIEALRAHATDSDVPVICYGLRTDFLTRLFPGSARLMELADQIEEVKSVCLHCDRKAIFNLRFRDGRPIAEGPVIELGTEESYQGVCSHHYFRAFS